MPTAADDKGFLENLADILNSDVDDARDRAESLDGSALIDLSDAVFRRDEAAVRALLGQDKNGAADESDGMNGEEETGGEDAELDDVDGFDGDFLIGDDEEKDEVREAEHTKGSPGSPLAIGDRVRVGAMRGIVHIPNGPGATVGVVVRGRLRMVDRSRIVRESHAAGGIVGLASVPDITRMQRLAGILTDIPDAPAAPEPAFVPQIDILAAPDRASSDEGSAADRAARALDSLERALPDLRIAELKPLRQRLTDVMAILNERREGRSTAALAPAQRRRKL